MIVYIKLTGRIANLFIQICTGVSARDVMSLAKCFCSYENIGKCTFLHIFS